MKISPGRNKREFIVTYTTHGGKTYTVYCTRKARSGPEYKVFADG